MTRGAYIRFALTCLLVLLASWPSSSRAQASDRATISGARDTSEPADIEPARVKSREQLKGQIQDPQANQGDDRLEQQIRFSKDAHGHPYQITFPRYDRLWIQAGSPVWSTRRGELFEALDLQLGWKLGFFLDYPDEEIWWRLRNELLHTQLRLGGVQPGGRLTVFSGQYLRHDRSSFVVVPTGETSELKLPAPFDIQLQFALGRLDVGFGGDTLRLLRAEILDADVLMDFWRDERYRHRIALGISGWYDINRLQQGGWQHEFAPFTGAKLLWAWESASGLFAWQATARCGAAVQLDAQRDARWRLDCQGALQLEWILAAINDKPLSLPLQVTYGHPPIGSSRPGRDLLQVQLGLRLSFLP